MAVMPATTESPARRIVVGVDDTDEAEAALRWAFDQAAATAASVEVVYAWERSELVPLKLPTIRVPDDEYQVVAEQLLRDVLARLEPLPNIEVTTTTLEGRPDEVLVHQAEHAQLLVVGSPGVGRLAGLLSGSAPYALVRDMPCPLVIVPLDSDHYYEG
jgi:nucleotide-binding universal stress UspA family protein